MEHALDPQYAARLGVNLDDLLVSQPSSGEEALQICEALVRSNAIDVIVVAGSFQREMAAVRGGLHIQNADVGRVGKTHRLEISTGMLMKTAKL